MTTLYLDRSGTILEASGEVLELRDATGRLERRIPIKFLERVVMRARCYFDSSTLANLVSHEVPVLILDGRAGRRLAHWVGALHAPVHGRAALACDLVEPLRGQIDEWIWQLFRRELLRPEHFGVEGSGACLLGKAGRSVFWREWEWRSRRWQRLLDRYAQHLAREFVRRSPAFDLLDDWESS